MPEITRTGFWCSDDEERRHGVPPSGGIFHKGRPPPECGTPNDCLSLPAERLRPFVRRRRRLCCSALSPLITRLHLNRRLLFSELAQRTVPDGGVAIQHDVGVAAGDRR